jgi:hypothetical protein
VFVFHRAGVDPALSFNFADRDVVEFYLERLRDDVLVGVVHEFVFLSNPRELLVWDGY